ncbi:MAG: CFI-box-CTERM domain-containing protein, partial [Prevotella histicola]
IATMAYGNYDHPQVVILRHFRDMFLSQRQWGRWFITYYYRYSPKLVERLKDHALINKFIRKVLDGFILFVKHKYK